VSAKSIPVGQRVKCRAKVELIVGEAVVDYYWNVSLVMGKGGAPRKA
jgi:hypothetical protein